MQLRYSDREGRNSVAQGCRDKMAQALADAWQNGECVLVKSTIDRAMNENMSRQWKDDAAAALPPAERQNFLNFVRG